MSLFGECQTFYTLNINRSIWPYFTSAVLHLFFIELFLTSFTCLFPLDQSKISLNDDILKIQWKSKVPQRCRFQNVRVKVIFFSIQ